MSASNRDQILNFASNYLNIASYHDYGPQGTQILGADRVNKIACGVSVSKELIWEALYAKCDMILTHHGIMWNNEKRDNKRVREILDLLWDLDITLASYHLPLDANKNIGNNISMLRHLGFVKDIVPFADLGFGGTFLGNCFIDQIRAKVPSTSHIFPYGGKIDRAAVITGSAGRYLEQAAEEGYQLFLTGEAEESSKYIAYENLIHFVAAGHYWTERWGIMNLARMIAKKFKINWEFIDIPNPV